MTRWRGKLAVAIVLPALFGPAQSLSEGAPAPPPKIPDARQTAETFLDAALNGRAREAAALGEPGKSYSREKKIMKDFQSLDAKKLFFVSVHADDQYALAITQQVTETRRGQQGQLTIRLVKKDKLWLVRDVDFRTGGRAKEELEEFLKRYPKAKEVPEKKDK